MDLLLTVQPANRSEHRCNILNRRESIRHKRGANLKKNDADVQRGSGLFIGSEPLEDVRHRSAMGKDDDDDSGKDGLLGGDKDDDSSDKGDSDGTDRGDTDTTDKRDSDGKD